MSRLIKIVAFYKAWPIDRTPQLTQPTHSVETK